MMRRTPVKNKSKILSTQLFCLFLLSRGVLGVAYGVFSQSGNMQATAIASAIGGIVSLLISIPCLCLQGDRGLLRNGFGRVISGFYSFYFFYIICITLTLFTVLRAETSDIKISLLILPLCITVAAIYGAYKGIEAIARTGVLILFAVVAAFVLLCISLFSKSSWLNLAPLGSVKVSDIINETIIIVGEQSCIPAIIFLYPHIKGNVKQSVVWWIIVLFGCFIALALFIASVLGAYSYAQPFPVYSWARLSSFGVIQRLDSLFSAIWSAGIFVRLALMFWALSCAIKYALGNKAAQFLPLLCGAAALGVAVLAPYNSSLRGIVLNGYTLLVATLICSLVLPLILIIKKKVNR